MSRVIVFIDAQNFYRGARRAFDSGGPASYRLGQFEPASLAELLAARSPGRALVETRVYTGRPDPYLQPKGHAANVLQCNTWERAGCTVIHRPLRYLRSWPQVAAQEKGIDVLIALDLVRLAWRGLYDVAIVCSGDNDLAPAVDEVVHEHGRAVEVAGWRSSRHRQRLNVPGRIVWCHWLSADDYEAVRDDTDYAAGL